MIIDLIRHTTPEIDAGICYGQTDLDLVADYTKEFTAIHKKLLPKYDIVISSPLQRCAKLARSLSCEHLEMEPRMMEYNFGDWELKPWAEFKSQKAQDWMNNFVDQPAPNGDSMISMQQRVIECWEEILQKNHKHIAVVTHSGVQRLIHAHVLDTPLNKMFRLELEFGAVIRTKHDRQTGATTIKHL